MNQSTSLLELLRPSERRLVMDLVEEAGVDVSDWSNYANGKKAPAANPRYCYEWVFTQPPNTTVLNTWHDELVPDGETVVLRGNMRRVAREAANIRSGARVGRAKRFDAAIATAWVNSEPFRVVICEGTRRTKEPGTKKSRVAKRMLDPMPWFVREYHQDTGDFVLERGDIAPKVADQFALGIPEQTPTEMKTISGTVYKRNAEVRRNALSRAAGLCEWCGRRGFKLQDGALYLETHHVVPLSEGGSDNEENVAALCANHHREAHYGIIRDRMRVELARRIRERSKACSSGTA